VAGTPNVTVAVFPRERFSRAAAALRRLFDSTPDIDFKLIVVDCNTPPRYWREIESVIAGRENVEVIRSDVYLRPNEARPLIVNACQTEYLCLVENDVFVEPGWLADLIAACEALDAEVAAPLVVETGGHLHVDGMLSRFDFVSEPDGVRLDLIKMPEGTETGPVQIIGSAEAHCLLFRSSVFQRVNPFDARITTRDFVDLSLQLKQAGARIALQPKVRAFIDAPPPVEPEEREFYHWRWDRDAAAASLELLCEKWGIDKMTTPLTFIRGQHHRTSKFSWRWFNSVGRVQRKLGKTLLHLLHRRDTYTYYWRKTPRRGSEPRLTPRLSGDES